jgi:hypothetical protein
VVSVTTAIDVPTAAVSGSAAARSVVVCAWIGASQGSVVGGSIDCVGFCTITKEPFGMLESGY